MSFSDKISWIGGMMGLFTGFSVISGIEVLYWLWFKVVFHKHDAEVIPEQNNISKKIEELKNKNEEDIKNFKVRVNCALTVVLFVYVVYI